MSHSRNMIGWFMKTYLIDQSRLYNFLQWENSKIFNITSKYYSIFNNKPPANWVAQATRDFLLCYSCLYHSSTIEIKLKKVHQNDVDISLIEVTPNKVRQSDINFSFIKITSKKVRRNDVECSSIVITSKKYVEMMWQFMDIFFSTYQHNIDIEPTLIRRGVSAV